MKKALFLLIYLQTTTSKLAVEDGRTKRSIADPTQKSLPESYSSKGEVPSTQKAGKRYDVSKLNHLDFLPATVTQEGKPYGDSENYEPIGDGVYLYTNNPGGRADGKQAAPQDPRQVKATAKGMLPQRNINEIMTNLEEEDKTISEEGKPISSNPSSKFGLVAMIPNSKGGLLAQKRIGMNDLVVPISAKEDVEAVSTSEVNMINDIEKNLQREDKTVDQDAFNHRHSVDGHLSLNFHADAQPEMGDPTLADNSYLAVSKRTSGTDSLVSQIEEVEKNLEAYADEEGLDEENRSSGEENNDDNDTENTLTKLVSKIETADNSKSEVGNTVRNVTDNANFFLGDEKMENEKKNVSSADYKVEEKLSKENIVHPLRHHHKKKSNSKRKCAPSKPHPLKDGLKLRNHTNGCKDHGKLLSQKCCNTVRKRNHTDATRTKDQVVKKTNTPAEESFSSGVKKFMTLDGNNIQIDQNTVEKVKSELSEQDSKIFPGSSAGGGFQGDPRMMGGNPDMNVQQQERSLGAPDGSQMMISNNMPSNIPSNLPNNIPNNMPNNMANNMVNNLPNSMPNNMASTLPTDAQNSLQNNDDQPLVVKPVSHDIYMQGDQQSTGEMLSPQEMGQMKQVPEFTNTMRQVPENTMKQVPEFGNTMKQVPEFTNAIKQVPEYASGGKPAGEFGGNVKQVNEFSSAIKVEDSNTNLPAEHSASKPKEFNDVNVQDGINSDELKDAINDSDLKGLKQIRTELDAQDLQTAMEYFGKDVKKEGGGGGGGGSNGKPPKQHIIQPPIELVASSSPIVGINKDGANSESKEKKEHDNLIISGLMDLIGKRNSSLTAIVDGAKDEKENSSQPNHVTKSKEEVAELATLGNPSFEDIAKKMEKFMNPGEGGGDAHGKGYFDSGDVSKVEPGNVLSVFHKVDEHASDLTSTPNDNLQVSKQTTKPLTTASHDELKEKMAAEKEFNTLSIEMIDNLFKGKHSENEEKLAVQQLMKGSDGAVQQMLKTGLKAETVAPVSSDASKGVSAVPAVAAGVVPAAVVNELQINGGKVLGGNVIGGRILGGMVLGGNVTGGEMDGGRITGGLLKNGLFENGLLENGIIEGGKVRGGVIKGGVIKAGIIDSGVLSGGIMAGGELINGSIEGGAFNGGEIYGGTLKSGRMDGGTLKAGMINGGVMKGGIIDGGVLEGGVMLAGEIRGGIVKSGVVRGGIIGKGVVVSDADIGPGVEIHDGMVTGGKITAHPAPDASKPLLFVKSETETKERRRKITANPFTDLRKPMNSWKSEIESKKRIRRVYRSNESRPNTMYSIQLTEENGEGEVSMKDTVPSKTTPIDNTQRNAIKKDASGKVSQSNKGSGNPAPAIPDDSLSAANMKLKSGTSQSSSKPALPQAGDKNVPYNVTTTVSPSSSYGDESQYDKNANPQTWQDITRIISGTREPLSKKLIANWELSTAVFNTIKGSPGRDLQMFNGIQIRNGHAVLDGTHGYLDAGDFQGECFSDPEACLEGFTVQMTVKIYSKSVFASRPHFIMDSGAVQNNSRGISLWVTQGYIFSMVVTREKTWCLHTMLYPYIEKWVSLTLTWGPELGLKMYINCQQFDQSSDHLSSECEKCEMCHQTDAYTRLMFGRPNTGPHYQVINMAIGMIALYERSANEKDVDKVCGKVEPTLPPTTAPSQQTSKKPEDLKPKKDLDIALKVSYPTPRTRLRTRPTKPHTTPVKWPVPATEAIRPKKKKKIQTKRPHLFASQNAAEIELAEPKGDTRSRIKTGASVKDLQLNDDEFPLLHFMEAENKATKAMKDPLHPSLDLIKNLKRR